MVDIRILSKYALCWNSFAVIRWAGRLVIRRGNTEDVNSFGTGLEQRKLLLAEGMEDDELNSRLYVVTLEFACNGEVCGELYRAIIKSPNENISAPVLRFESSTKSGEQ